MIRLATLEDTQVLVDLYMQFYQTTDYSRIYPADHETIEKLTQWIITEGAMVVYEDGDGEILGSAGAWIGPATFNMHVKTATEVVYYLDPTARGHRVAPALLQALEERCNELGAISLQMVRLRTSPPEVDALYQMNGYKPSESYFTKRLID